VIGRGDADGRPRDTGLRFGLYLVYFALAELPLLNRFQFTTTAFVAAQAGLFLMLVAWRRRVVDPDAKVLAPLCAAVGLLVLGSLVRLESLAMAVLVAAPVALLFLKDFSVRALAPCSVAGVAAVALVVGGVAYDRWAYEHDAAWQGYRQLNQVRGKFHDGSWTHYSAETAPIFARVGWTQNDHAMIARWFSDDATLYNAATLTSIVDAYPWQRSRNLSGLWRHAFRDIARNRYVLAILLSLPFAFVFVHRGRTARLAILGSALGALALIACVIWIKKVPPQRVFFPLMSFPLTASLLAFAWRDPQAATGVRFDWGWTAWRRFPLVGKAAFVLLVVGLVMSGMRQARQSSLVEHDRVVYQSFLNEVRPGDGKVYVTWEAALPYELHSPLDALDCWKSVPVLSVAWPQRTACHEAIKQQCGISDLARAMYERDDVVLVATTEHRELFAKFAKEHFDADVEFAPTHEAGKKFVAGRLQARAAGSGTASRQGDGAKR
jgi:hypothetical protein